MKKIFVSFFVLFFLTLSLAISARTRSNTEIMIQVFGWKLKNAGSPGNWYNLIAEHAEELGKMGFTLAWFPPPSRSVDDPGYLPGDYYDLGTQQNPTFYGTADQLKATLDKMNKAGIKPLADAVLNHRCAGKQDCSGLWNQFIFPSGKAAWNQSAIVKGEFGGTGNPDTGDNFEAAPDIDHTNPNIQQDIIAYLNWLKTLGFVGWRYDFAKGYAPKFVTIFDKGTDSQFSVAEVFTNMAYDQSKPQYNQDAHRQVLCDYLNGAAGNVTVFDVTTKGILQEAVKGEYWRLRDQQGKAPGLIGWNPQRAVTFIDNHDTGSQQNLWPFPADKVCQGYAYIMTHPGIPCVLWEHIYDWKLMETIKTLMAIRQNYGIKADSSLRIEKADQGLYAAFIDEKIAIKLGSADWCPDSSFKLLTSGDQYAIWGKK
ncbi:MAG: alpha-amylase [Candidatus Riflebacteria bacterium]|nr:alpha-amylase [Candidatus Riflebacteria bacterium]